VVVDGDPRVSEVTRSILADPSNESLISIVSLCEMLVKHRVGKLDVMLDLVPSELNRVGFTRLPLTERHLTVLVDLPFHHRDPFDHLLMAQAIAEDLTLVSEDQRVGDYLVRVMRC